MRIFDLIILILCFIYPLKATELDKWSVVQYISDDYPGINYFELNNGSIGHIYIDALEKREQQKKCLKVLESSKVYPFIRANPRILCCRIYSLDFTIEYEGKIKRTETPEYLACYLEGIEAFEKQVSEIKKFLHDSYELLQELSKTQKDFDDIDAQYSEYEAVLFEFIQGKLNLDLVKDEYPDVFKSLIDDGITELIWDHKWYAFPSERSAEFFFNLILKISRK